MRLAAICAFLATLAAAAWVLAPAPSAEPGVYPVEPQPPTPPPYRFAIVDKNGSPFFTDREIIWYEWATHTICLGPAVTPAEIFRRCEGGILSGVPFSVVADGVTCYRGAFFAYYSAERNPSPVIIDVIPRRDREGVLTIEFGSERGFPIPKDLLGADPRADVRIRTALQGVGKLRE